MKKAIKVGLIALLVTLVLAISGTALIVSSNRGTAWAWRMVKPALSDVMRIENLSGRLIGPLFVDGVELDTPQMIVQLTHGELDWASHELFRARLSIRRLRLNGLHVENKARAEPAAAEKFNLPQALGLPIAIDLNDVEMQDFQYRASDTAKPFVINNGQLSASLNDQQLKITRLKLASPLFQVDSQLALGKLDDLPLNGEIDWKVMPPDYPPLEGHSLLSGNLTELNTQSKIGEPYNADVSITLNDLLNKFTARSRLNIDHLTPASIHGNWPAIPLSATLEGSYDGKTAQFQNLSVKRLDQPGNLEAQGKIDLHQPNLVLDLTTQWQSLQWPLEGEPKVTSPKGQLSLSGAWNDLRGRLSGQLNKSGEMHADIHRKEKDIHLALDWKTLTWPVADTEIRSSKGEAVIDGTLDRYRIGLNAGIEVPGQTDGFIELSGVGSDKQVRLDKLDITALDGTLSGNAAIRWQPDLKLTMDLHGQELNPGILYSEWPGRLAGSLKFDMDKRGDRIQATIQEAKVYGKLRGYPIDAAAEADYLDSKLALKTLHLVSGNSFLDASGQIGERVDLDWRLKSDNLGEIWPTGSGQVEGEGSVSGLLPRPFIKAWLKGQDVDLDTLHVTAMNLEADLDTALVGRSQIQFKLENARLGGTQISAIDLHGEGNAEQHTAQLTARTSEGDLDFALQGRLEHPWQPDMHWSGQLKRASIQPAQLAAWTLDGPLKVDITKDTQNISAGCWVTNPDGRICIEGKHTQDMTVGTFRVTQLPLAYVRPWLPDDVTVKGAVNGKGSYKQSGQLPAQVLVDLLTTSGRLLTGQPESFYRTSGGTDGADSAVETILAFSPSTLHVESDRSGVKLQAQLILDQAGQAQLDMTMAEQQVVFMDRVIAGRLHADLQKLYFLEALFPEVANLDGQLKADMKISGSLGQPRFDGLAKVSQFTASLAQSGLTLSNGNLILQGRSNQGLTLTGSVKSGAGELQLQGKINPLHEPLADIKVRGQNFTVVDNADANVTVSPDLRLVVNDHIIDVKGSVEIPTADITAGKLPSSAVAVSSDQHIIRAGENSRARESSRALHADIKLVLGDKVMVNSFGLEGRISGALAIQERPGEPVTASGDLNIVDGKYLAYGQELTIQQGRLLFAGGPVSEPGMDIRATRKPKEDIEVGVQVRGSFKSPDLTLFSTPSMPQQTQLSYLILGRAPNEATNAENSAITQAAMALSVKGGDYLVKNLGQHIGIDDIGIDTEPGTGDSEQAALMLGKYLSPKLYLSYGLGLFEPISTLRLKYYINKHWEIVTESSGVQSGGDIFYTIERGD